MNWLQEDKFNPRPIVTVEDHVYHISELLRIIQKTDQSIMSDLTVVCLDRAGSDTDAAVEEWLQTYPHLQIAARIADANRFCGAVPRLSELADRIFESQNDYCRRIATLIRPAGLLLQDIELESLSFVPRDRWWESTMLASTVRGIVGERPPKCAFISNKRGYEATFGAELLAAGHDPRDVLNKYELEQVAVPFLAKYLNEHFAFRMEWSPAKSSMSATIKTCRVSTGDEEKVAAESQLDAVLWPAQNETVEVGGKAFDPGKKARIGLAVSGNESATWQQLIEARLDGLPGVSVQSVGERVAPTGALRAELTNAAARHIHSVRKRLLNPQDIVTVAGHYRLRDQFSVGIVRNV